MKTGKIIGTSLFLASVLAGVGVALAPAAHATDEPYILAAWTINTPDFDGDTITDVWGGGGQTLATSIPTGSTDLILPEDSVPCGAWYQIDLYNNDQVTADLLANGHLYGPSNPPESAATGVNPWYVSYWYSGDCVTETPPPTEEPTPTPEPTPPVVTPPAPPTLPDTGAREDNLIRSGIGASLVLAFGVGLVLWMRKIKRDQDDHDKLA